MSMAQVWLARLRAGAGAAGSPEAAAASACFRRMPRALFEYQHGFLPGSLQPLQVQLRQFQELALRRERTARQQHMHVRVKPTTTIRPRVSERRCTTPSIRFTDKKWRSPGGPVAYTMRQR
jgi:hypothetical protein